HLLRPSSRDLDVFASQCPRAGSPRFPYTALFRSRAHGRGKRRRRAASELWGPRRRRVRRGPRPSGRAGNGLVGDEDPRARTQLRSEEHTSELQSRENLVCRLLLEKKKNKPRGRSK